MRRFACPKCAASLIEGTRQCPRCKADTAEVVMSSSPGEEFPEIEFGSPEQAKQFASLIAQATDVSAAAEPFYPLLQFSRWGSPCMEEFFKRIEAEEITHPANVDLHSLTLREHLTREQRQVIRHYLPKVEAAPTEVQQALVECLSLREWTPVAQLSEATGHWIPVLERSKVVETNIAQEQRLNLCTPGDMQQLLRTHGLNDGGTRAELVARILDQIKPEVWRAFAQHKRPGNYVRCVLPIAADLLTYLFVRRRRVDLLVRTIVRRHHMEVRMKYLAESANADPGGIDQAGCGFPPLHVGCRCDIALMEAGDRKFLSVEPSRDACSLCVEAAHKVRMMIEAFAEDQKKEEAAAPAPAEKKPWPRTPGSCPRCREPMYNARRSGFIFHACSKCQGIWLPKEQYDELVREHPQLLGRLDTDFRLHVHSPTEQREFHRCPDCNVQLEDKHHIVVLTAGQKVTTDTLVHPCPQCHGIWFDSGELHAVSRAVTAQTRGA